MSDAYKLQYNGMTLTYPGWNGYVGYKVDPYNPLGLPPFTIRVKFESGYTPAIGDSQTLVDAGQNVWDITKNDPDWTELFLDSEEFVGMPIEEVLGANTTGVTNMNSTFMMCDSLTSVALFNTSSCTDMNNMFASCTSLTTVPLFDTSSCIDMGYMFYNCTSLTTVPLFDTGSCLYLYGMFNGCTSLTTVPLFDTSSCRDMDSMFASCTSLTTVPLFDTGSCRGMSSMFSSCTSLISIPLFNTSSCTRMNHTFNGCINVQSGALALYQQASTQTTPPATHAYTFRNCGSNTVTGAAELAQIPTEWGGTYTPGNESEEPEIEIED